MNKEKTFLNIITYAPLFFIPFLVSIIIIFGYQIYSQSFDSKVKDLKQDLLQSKKDAVENKVKNLSELVVYQRSRIKKELINRVKGRVYTAHAIANEIYFEYKGVKSEEEIKDIINTTLRTYRWNDSESYIWVMDFFGVHSLLENRKDLNTSSFINFKDAQNRYIIQEEIAICKGEGEGYLWDTFTKPNKGKTQYDQVAFVKVFKPYNWCLGSAEFLDTATKKTNKFLFDMLSHVDKIGPNYVVMIDKEGNLLVHNKLTQFVGENVEINDTLVLDTMASLKGAIEGKESTSYIYDWYNPSTKKIEKKYAYIQRVPSSDWIIGSGFFFSEVLTQLRKQKVDMLEIYNANTKNIFYIAILIICISLILSFLLSQKIRKRFYAYDLRIREKNKELSVLNASLEEKVQVRTIELENIKNDFQKLAITDSLTNLHNRYSIMKILTREISHSNRYDTALSVIMYDIDHFKVINDTYGHSIGDKALVLLSKLVQHTIRDVDFIGRYGGEEFLIIMPNTTLHDASVYAERLRKLVEGYDFEDIGKMTVSMGLVSLHKDEDIDLVFKRVDELLYLSKKNGRNQVSY